MNEGKHWRLPSSISASRGQRKEHWPDLVELDEISGGESLALGGKLRMAVL